MFSFRPRVLAVAVLTTSAIVALPVAASSAVTAPAPTPSWDAVPGPGTLNLELTGGAASSLARQKVTVSAGAPATRAGSLVAVPASTVSFGREKVLTTNGGSIVFQKGSRRVRFTTISTHLGRSIRVRARINGKSTTVLTADRKKTRVEILGLKYSQLHATKLRLTTAGAREIRRGLRLSTFGRGTLAKAYGRFNVPDRPAPDVPPVPQDDKPEMAPIYGLGWTQVNVFDTSAPADENRTWLGYFTNSPGASTARGTFTPSGEATGDTVTPDSPRGPQTQYRVRFRGLSSHGEPGLWPKVVRLGGVVTFRSQPAPAGHGITVTLENPRVEFDGSATAKLYATGTRTVGGPGGAGTTERYDDSQPVFTLDLTTGWGTKGSSMTWSYFQVQPTIAVTGHAFPASYPAGSGPDRTPNTFGTFDITVPTIARDVTVPSIPTG